MKLALIVPGILVAAIATVTAAQTTPRLITDPQWVKTPTREEILSNYPARLDYGGSPSTGSGVLNCAVTDKSRLAGCVVSSETPVAHGIGVSMMRLAPLFVLGATTADGQPTAGARVLVRFDFPRRPPEN